VPCGATVLSNPPCTNAFPLGVIINKKHMSIVKSLSVGNGDMFYIKHNTDNFSIIDCCLSDNNKKDIVDELKNQSSGKNITRFISTHPDEDHIQQLDYLDDNMPIVNFYCVKNEATKKDETTGFKRYCKLRDGDKAYHIYKDCSRKWMNQSDETRGSAGINILWPILDNEHFKTALQNAKEGKSPNNISPIITYSLNESANFMWLGDLETDFMSSIESEVNFQKTNIVFAPHHGRDSGKIPESILKKLQPDIIIIGEAPSGNINYYKGYNTITQNSAGDILFDCISGKVHIYVSNKNYIGTTDESFLKKENKSDYNYYLGTLIV
jgi:beta-lactamase superfamily II metal-dependent hydrolase